MIVYLDRIFCKYITCLNTCTEFPDSEDDAIPLFTYLKDVNDGNKLDSNLLTSEVCGYVQQQTRYCSGDYVLVKYWEPLSSTCVTRI